DLYLVVDAGIGHVDVVREVREVVADSSVPGNLHPGRVRLLGQPGDRHERSQVWVGAYLEERSAAARLYPRRQIADVDRPVAELVQLVHVALPWAHPEDPVPDRCDQILQLRNRSRG